MGKDMNTEQIREQFYKLKRQVPTLSLEREMSKGEHQRVNDAALEMMIQARVLPRSWSIHYACEPDVGPKNRKFYIRCVESGYKYHLD
jgi:hypothetical protein